MTIFYVVACAAALGAAFVIRHIIRKNAWEDDHYHLNGEERKKHDQMKPRFPNLAPPILLGVILGAGIGSIARVPAGHVGVPVMFGAVSDYTITEGVSLVSPLETIVKMDGRRYQYDFGGDDRLISVSADENPLTMDVAFPITLRPDSANLVYQRIGGDDRYRRQLRTHAREAVRRVVARYEWNDVVTKKRDEVARELRIAFERNVTQDLIAHGFSELQAGKAFIFSDVQMRRALPDQKVLNAIAEKVASQQDLERQEVLTEIAQEEANRRANEGAGVSNLFAELPDGFTPEQIRLILDATSNKTKAEALMRAVESGKVEFMVLDGGALPSVGVGR